jgi:hypothetical protein
MTDTQFTYAVAWFLTLTLCYITCFRDRRTRRVKIEHLIEPEDLKD